MRTCKGYGGEIELHDDHLVIRREGLAAKAAGLGATRQIPLAALSGVNLKPANLATNGHLQLRLGSDPARDHRGDPDTVLFTWRQSSAFHELANLLEEEIAKNVAAGVDPSTVAVDRGESRLDRLRDTAGVSFGGVTLRNGYVESAQGGGPVAGARATVDTAGQLSRRITVTRLVLTGPLALGWKKKMDERELYLVVEGDGWAISVPVDPKKGAQARSFAAKVNAAAAVRSGSSGGAPTRSAESSPPEDVLEQIQKLADMRDAGVLTEEEFGSKKADLLRQL